MRMRSSSPRLASEAGDTPRQGDNRLRALEPSFFGRQTLVAVLVSVVLLAYVFVAHRVDPAEVAVRLGTVPYWSLGVVLGLWLAALLARAARYWVLLEFRAGLWALTLVTLLRNLLVDVVPLRIGAAVAYLYAVIARLRLPADAAVASFALASVLDTLAMVPLALLAVLVLGAGPLPPALLAGGGVLVLAGAGALLILLAPILRSAARVADLFSRRLAGLARALEGAAITLHRLETKRVIAPAFALSFAVRLLRYGAYYCLLLTLLPDGSRVDFVRVSLSVAAAELAAAMPVPTLGGWGSYEVVGVLAFKHWLELPPSVAVTAVVATHALTQASDLALGLPALAWAIGPRLRRPTNGALRRPGSSSSSALR